MIRGFLALFALTGMAHAQDTVITSPIDGSQTILLQPDAAPAKTVEAPGAELRGLDKVSGDVVDLRMQVGATQTLGRIEITLGACRFPEDNQTGEAFAWIEVVEPTREAVVFKGWMIASSPALSALDHARYDVWVIRCTTA